MGTVGKQAVRQAARRAALEAQARMRAQRAERDKRLSALGVEVIAALEERDEWVARCEQRAAGALRRMVQEEGLSLREAVVWCGPGLSRREATRLGRVGDGLDAGPGAVE